MVGDNSSSVGESGQSVNKAAPPIAGEENADLADVGYKLLLFLCYSFDGKVFPRGGPMLLLQSHGEVSWELLQLVTAPDLRPTPSVFSLQSSAELQASASSSLSAYPYLSKLGEVDMSALFHALHKGIALVQLLANPVYTPVEGEGEDEDGGEEIPCSTTSFMAMQTPPVVLNKGLSSVFDRILNFCIRADSRDSLASTVSNNNSNSNSRKEHSPGRTEKIYFEEFADLIVQSRCSLLLSFLERYVQFCAVSSSVGGQEREKCENQLVILAKFQPKEDPVHCAALASILVENNFGLASLHAVRSVVSTEQFRRSLSFYVKVGTDSPSEMKRFAYLYIDEAMRMASRCEQSSRVVYIGWLRSEILKLLVPLCYLDLPQTRRLVENYLSAHAAEITENSTQDLKMQYALLSALVPGPEILPGERGRVLRASFTEAAVVAYFSLLATYDPSNALTFLKSFESHYPLDACLQICQQKGISEAVAFLMEKKGDVLDALLLLLRDVTTKLKQVRRDVDAQLRSEMATQAAATKAKLQRVGGGDSSAVGSIDGERYIILSMLGKQDVERAEAAKKLPAFRMLEGLVNCVAELCSRNNLTDQSGGMWLTAFDHLLMERQTMRSGPTSSSGEVVLTLIGLMLQTLMNHTSTTGSGSSSSSSSSTNNHSKSTNSASHRPTAAITPQDIIRRVTAQGNAAGIRLGEFKSIMLNMLSSNAQELVLQSLTNSVIQADLAALHKQKIATLKRYVLRSDGCEEEEEEEEEDVMDDDVVGRGGGDGDGGGGGEGDEDLRVDGRRSTRNGRRSTVLSLRRRYHLPPPLRISPSDAAVMPLSARTMDISAGVPGTSHQFNSPSSPATGTGAAAAAAAAAASAFIEACRTRPPRRKSCDYSQFRADFLVAQASSLRFVLATGLPAVTSASFSDVNDNSSQNERRQPGRLEREPLYLASI